ncbi:two-component sensor histidine kinase [Geomonas silvestris]|uniref:histidine kinase n=1 Tax=Geomonas silvestris TaxID=2740184 RepID=A0A6V8MK25_9BACT|nr:ATP-binding protein [Geomonas silvestris]GFO60284.1 two-component sensor histidine kinase [Geomonas silvestris]
MKLMIKYRLFLAMLTATGAVVICMFLIMQWSIGRGFLAYVNTIEKERVDKLAQVLEQSYAARGSWEFLREDPVQWFSLIDSTLPRELIGAEPPERRERRMARRAEALKERGFMSLTTQQLPPHAPHRFESRVILLDASHRRVAGAGRVPERVTLKQLSHDDTVVGYLGLLPRLRLTDRHQLVFMQQQQLAMALIAVVMLLVSAAISLPLANRLVHPIKKLAASLHRLASGAFETRVAVGPLDELGQLARDVNTLAFSLEKNEQARRLWVADISHELRTPLSILRGEIEAIQDGVREAGPETMRSLHAEVMRLSRLVDDLYQLSLCDIGALSYRKSDQDLAQLLDDSVGSFGTEFEQKGIALVAELPGNLPCRIFADPIRLQQLFDNILDNSLKYTDPGGRLVVRLECQGDRALVTLADSAPGVTPEELGRLFDRLYRVESSRNRALGGAGLGLAICKSIVEAHEGTIDAHPSPLGGIQIRIELPLTGSRT